MKISFDYDKTLTLPVIYDYAKNLKSRGKEIFIITSRFENPLDLNNQLFETAEKLDVPRGNIRFTNGLPKTDFLQDIQIHYDDDPLEIEFIKESGIKCLGVLITDMKLYKNHKG